MSIEIIKEKTCAFSGHRTLYKDFNLLKIKEVILELISSGYDTFLIGMAIGFDSVCFNLLESIRREKNIKIIACVPCFKQDIKFTPSQKAEYKRELQSADEVIMVSNEYTPYAMIKRNCFMIDNASALICYLRQNTGGTKQTVNYAEKKNVKIYYV